MKKIFVLLLSAILFSCSSSNKVKEKKYDALTARFPGSIKELEEMAVTKDIRIKINPELLKKSEYQKGQFYSLLKEAQANGYRNMVIEKDTGPLLKLSTFDEKNISGDFFILIATNFSKTDESIRKDDYDDLYETIKRMSWLKFRVTINLVASADDLKAALKNKRPTIISWTSGGDENYFYDFNQVQIPYSVFKNTSPSVYQFILTSYNAFTAKQNAYEKSIPASMKLVFHPEGKWDPFANYPGLSVQGKSCKPQDDYFIILNNKTGNHVGTTIYADYEQCHYTLVNSNEDYMCEFSRDRWAVFNFKTNSILSGRDFETNFDCASAITNSLKGKICRDMGEEGIHIVDRSNNVGTEKFEDINSCFKVLLN